jgi:hypothetical protein
MESSVMNLEQEARTLMKNYLWTDTTRWVLGEGCSSSEYRREQAQLKRLGEIAGTLGEERVREIWEEVRADIRSDMASAAEQVMEAEVIRSWLNEPGTDTTAADHALVQEEIRLALRCLWAERLHAEG